MLVHDFYIGQPKGRQILDNDVALFIESKLTLGSIIGTRLDLGIRVGIGEIVFGDFLIILATRNLFLKDNFVYFFSGESRTSSSLRFSSIVSNLLFFHSLRFVSFKIS